MRNLRQRHLCVKEVQLLSLLHGAGFPVLGEERLGKVARVATACKWRWEFAGVFGDECDTEAAALQELRFVRSRLLPAWNEIQSLQGPPPVS